MHTRAIFKRVATITYMYSVVVSHVFSGNPVMTVVGDRLRTVVCVIVSTVVLVVLL